MNDKKDLIYSTQIQMFGKREISDIIGFGSYNFRVQEVSRAIANKIIIENHYSKKFYNCTYIHLGVYIKDSLLGVLQYGYALNPASGDSVVKGTENDGYLELNRMWLSDEAPRNSESMAIAYSIRYIRSRHKKVAWIQSFADERCKCFGIVYQAANFGYYGEHTAIFWQIGDEYFHNIIKTAKRKAGKKGVILKNAGDEAIQHTLRQFRYLYFIDKKAEKRCTKTKQPYLKWFHTEEDFEFMQF